MASIPSTSRIRERVSIFFLRWPLALGCLPPRQRSGSFWLFADHRLGKTWRCCNTKLLDGCSRDHQWILSSVRRLLHVWILTAWSRATDTSQGFCRKSETDLLPHPYPLRVWGNVTSTFFNVLYPKGALYLGCEPYAVYCSLTSQTGLTWFDWCTRHQGPRRNTAFWFASSMRLIFKQPVCQSMTISARSLTFPAPWPDHFTKLGNVPSREWKNDDNEQWLFVLVKVLI